METPLITTIIPTYKRPERLKKAILSVLKQTYPHFQLCIYDNASNDATADVVAEFARKDNRIKYHCHSENIGAVENFQYGLNRVNTPYFSFLSDDDYLLPQFYETALQGFDKHPDAAISLTTTIEMRDTGEIVTAALHSWPNQEYFGPHEALYPMIANYSNWTGVLFRTEPTRKIGPLDQDIKAIDVDFLLRLTARYPTVISKNLGAVFIMHSASYSGNAGLKLFWPGWKKIIDNLTEDEQVPQNLRAKAEQLLQTNLKTLLFITALRYLVQGQFAFAKNSTEIFSQQKGDKFRCVLLLSTIFLCKKSTIIHQLIVLLFRFKQLYRKIKNSGLQKEYGRMIMQPNIQETLL